MLIPYYRQTTEYTCGPACLKMVFEYLGKEMAEEELAVLLRTDPETGTNTDDMAPAVVDQGFLAFEKKEASLEDVRDFLSREIPVIVDFIEPSEEDRHFSIIVGADADRISFNDPWNGEMFTMHADEFERRWENPKNRYPKWMMTISKREEDLH